MLRYALILLVYIFKYWITNMTHKAEYTRLFTTNTSAKIGTTHAASNNVVTAVKVSGGGTL